MTGAAFEVLVTAGPWAVAAWAWWKAAGAREEADAAQMSARLSSDHSFAAQEYASHALSECREAHKVAHQAEATTLHIGERLGVDLTDVAGRG